jgi:hypothetical protein
MEKVGARIKKRGVTAAQPSLDGRETFEDAPLDWPEPPRAILMAKF